MSELGEPTVADEYTYAFTTDSIRADLHHLWNLSGAPGKRAAIDAEFDRWLAAHDREVAAKALREAATDERAEAERITEQMPALGMGLGKIRANMMVDRVAHLSAARRLEDRADRIESQASEKGASDGEQ